jgi:hypothetical protein
MRFMVIVKATSESEKEGPGRDPQFLHDMGKYNEELIKAGIVPAMDGLHPSSKGARVKFSGKNRTVIDGPFTEAKELIAGFSILQVKSLEEAIGWVKRGPNCKPAGDYEVEIRQVFEMEDFAPILSEEQIQHKVAKRAEMPNQTANNSRTCISRTCIHGLKSGLIRSSVRYRSTSRPTSSAASHHRSHLTVAGR